MTVEELYHPEYSDACEVWQTIEDVCAGPRTVKAAGDRYLPELSDETPKEYEKRKRRAVFFGATKRTRSALVGLLMRKPPTIVIPDSIELLTRDVTLSGLSLNSYIRCEVEQAVSTGRSVSFIDWSEEEARPYISFYTARNVVNWAPIRVNGRYEIGLLILREESEAITAAGVEKEEVFKEFRWTADGVIFRKWTASALPNAKAGERGRSELTNSEFAPMTRRGQVLKSIPAVIHNASHLGTSIGEAPLEDVAETNILHYMASADLENGRHICGLPTPYAIGVVEGDDDLFLGSTKAWTTTNDKAKFGFIEFNGAGLTSLVLSLEEKVKYMAILGARLLFDQKSDAEAFETVKMRSVSENSALSNIAGYQSVTLTAVMQWFVWWMDMSLATPQDIGDKVSVIINDDFLDADLEPAKFQAYVAALQSNAISFDVFFRLCKKGEIYPDNWTIEEELAAISQRPPATLPPPPPIDPNKTPPDDEEEEEEEAAA